MTAKEILDGCRHSDAHIREADGHADEVAAPCYACAERAIAAAVMAEREACAKLADAAASVCHFGSEEDLRGLAADIRARGGSR